MLVTGAAIGNGRHIIQYAFIARFTFPGVSVNNDLCDQVGNRDSESLLALCPEPGAADMLNTEHTPGFSGYPKGGIKHGPNAEWFQVTLCKLSGAMVLRGIHGIDNTTILQGQKITGIVTGH